MVLDTLVTHSNGLLMVLDTLVTHSNGLLMFLDTLVTHLNGLLMVLDTLVTHSNDLLMFLDTHADDIITLLRKSAYSLMSRATPPPNSISAAMVKSDAYLQSPLLAKWESMLYMLG